MNGLILTEPEAESRKKREKMPKLSWTGRRLVGTEPCHKFVCRNQVGSCRRFTVLRATTAAATSGPFSVKRTPGGTREMSCAQARQEYD